MNTIILRQALRSDPHKIFSHLCRLPHLAKLQHTNQWLIPNYTDVYSVLKNDHYFSSDLQNEPDQLDDHFFLRSRSMVGMDAQHHLRLRRSISWAFSPSKLAMYQNIIRSICKQLIKRLALKKQFDVVEEFALPLPMMVLIELVGLDMNQLDLMCQWVQCLLTWQTIPSQHLVIERSRDIQCYLAKLIASKRIQPQNDWLSILANRKNKIHLELIEILSLIRLLFVAGTDTTTKFIANSIYLLLRNPCYLNLLKQHKVNMDLFIEECLRLDGPVMGVVRRATRDIRIKNTKIQRGDHVFAMIGSANRDPLFFDHPETLCLDRRSSQLSFGAGSHYCLGSKLARLQIKIALDSILEILDDYVMVNDDVTYSDSLLFRGIKKLELRRRHFI